MRIGWICVRNKELKAKLLSYKSTADLHTNIFSQLVPVSYTHLDVYKRQPPAYMPDRESR